MHNTHNHIEDKTQWDRIQHFIKSCNLVVVVAATATSVPRYLSLRFLFLYYLTMICCMGCGLSACMCSVKRLIVPVQFYSLSLYFQRWSENSNRSIQSIFVQNTYAVTYTQTHWHAHIHMLWISMHKCTVQWTNKYNIELNWFRSASFHFFYFFFFYFVTTQDNAVDPHQMHKHTHTHTAQY